MSEQKQQVYGFAGFRLDVPNRTLLRDGRPVVLQAKAFDMLVVLIENGGRLVGKDELFSSVWPGQIVEESNLTVQVSAIRKALGDHKDNPPYIATVPGHGYRFTPEIQRFFETEQGGRDDDVLIEHHSHSRIVVETEKGNGAELGSPVSLTQHPRVRAGDNGPDALAVQSGTTHKIAIAGSMAARRRSSRLPVRWWQAAGVGAIAVFVSAFALYRYRLPVQPPASLAQVTLKRLTSNGKAVNAGLSPDGKLFVFVLGTIGNPRGLWLGHVSGGEPIALRPPAAVDYPTLKFSPDGNSLYYVVTGEGYQRGALFRIGVFGGAPEKLCENIAPEITFAPDMKQFAFTRLDEASKTSVLAIANVDGSAEREICSRPLDHRFLSGTTTWSPDGKTIAVGAVSDDERARSRQVLLVDVAGRQITQLNNERYGQLRGLLWLNDHELLINAAEGTLRDAQIRHVSVPSGEATPINSDLYSYDFPQDRSADGDSLLVIQAQMLTNIWVAPANKFDEAKQITFGTIGRKEGASGLEWTPTGQLLYVASEEKSRTLWTMAADGSKQKQLTPAGYWDQHPTATADGRFIVFQSNRSGSQEAWRMNTDGSGLVQVTHGGNNQQPSVSPDGKWVVYVSTDRPASERLGTLWRIALEGGAPLRLADGVAAWPRVSPDGQLIACEYATVPASQPTKLALIPIAGGQPVKLFELPPEVTFRYGLRWTPDGSAVTYRDWVNGIWRQLVDGGAPQRLPGLPEEKLYAYGWSPDGRQFAYTRGTETRDVILIRNFR